MVTLGELLEQKRRENLAANEQLSQGLQVGSTKATQQAQQIAVAERANRFNPLNTLASAGVGFLTGGPAGAVVGALGAKKGDTDVVGSAAQGMAQGTAAKFLGGAPGLQPLPDGGMTATGAATEVAVDPLSNIVRNLAATGNEAEKAGLLKTMGAPEALTKPLEAMGDKATTGKLQTITAGLQAIESDVLAGDLDATQAIKKAKTLKSAVDSLPMKATERKEVNTAYNTSLKSIASAKKTEDTADQGTPKDYFDSNGDIHTVVRNKSGKVLSVDEEPVDGFKIPKGWSNRPPKDDSGTVDSKDRANKITADGKYNEAIRAISDEDIRDEVKKDPEIKKQYVDEYIKYLKGGRDTAPIIVPREDAGGLIVPGKSNKPKLGKVTKAEPQNFRKKYGY